MQKAEIIDIFNEIAVLLELSGASIFKIRAYQNGARALETLTDSLDSLVQQDRLKEVKSLGESLQQKILELVKTGHLVYYEELKAATPPGLLEMMQIPSLGPKKVKAVYEQLGIKTIEELEQACKAGRLQGLSGFGAKTEAKILDGIAYKRQYASKHLLAEALAVAQPILAKLKEHPDVIRCNIAGSLRRSKEVIGDVDFVVASTKPTAIIEFFVNQVGVIQVSVRGDTKATVILTGGIQADLRVVSDTEYPFTLAYFTGSKEHNIVMRQRAIQRGLRLNEYGLFRSLEETRDPKLAIHCTTEEAIFKALDLDYIPPELRENYGEIVASESKQLPKLVTFPELKGSLHNHSNWSDGSDSIQAIAQHMDQLGFAYWAITDHSKASFQANGLYPEKLRDQIKQVQQFNQKMADQGKSFRLLSGAEVDITKMGLDCDNELLSELDVVVASLHVPASDEAENTHRLIQAAQNPYVHMLGHLTGRLLLQREPYKINTQAVIEACAATGTWLELNAQPNRLDLDWRLWAQFRHLNIKCVINCDAHSLNEAKWLPLGTSLARKGWLSPERVINTLPLPNLLKALQAKRTQLV